MAISLCSVLEKNDNLPPASPAKIKQDGQTVHSLLLLTSNNAAASQISLSVAFLQSSEVLFIRFLVTPLSQFVLSHKKGKKTLALVMKTVAAADCFFTFLFLLKLGIK